MTGSGVLVSVRDAAEAEAALAAGAAVIDVKEPARGSLGRAEARAVAAVAQAVGDRVPWTLAAGELAEGVDALAAWLGAVRAALPDGAAGPAAVKVGLAGMVGRTWQADLARLHAAVPPGCAAVAVAYADCDRAGAPAPLDVIAAARDAGCAWLLIDTADKRAPGLFGLRSREEVAGWVAAARARGLGVVLAGRIAMGEIPLAASIGCDFVAVRSAVCSNADPGDVRLGHVSQALVAAAVAGWAAARPT
ncbi:MAG: (5-formylfuran-3-yl)methyl phosphate synthase [Planctomycetia bacterium]